MSHTRVGWASYSSCQRTPGTIHTVLAIRRHGLEVRSAPASVLPLLPRPHVVLQGKKAAGVSVHSHGPVLVILQVLSPPGGPLLVVSLNVEICEENNQRNHVSDLEI